MEQNLPLQDKSFKSDSESEEEAEDTALLIDEEDSKENLENNLIPEPQQLCETVQNVQMNHWLRNQSCLKIFYHQPKQKKLFQRFLAQPKMLCHMKNFKLKIPQRTLLKLPGTYSSTSSKAIQGNN